MDYSISLAARQQVTNNPQLQHSESIQVAERPQTAEKDEVAHQEKKPVASAEKQPLPTPSTAEPTERIMPHVEPVHTEHTVSRTIILNWPDGQKKRIKQTHTFIRHGEKNPVTDDIKWVGWDAQEAVLPAYAVAKVMGYISEPSQVDAVTVRPDSEDLTVQVTYRLKPVQTSQQRLIVVQNEQQPAMNNEALQAAVHGAQWTGSDSDQPQQSRRHRRQRVPFFAAIGLAFVTLFGFRRRAFE